MNKTKAEKLNPRADLDLLRRTAEDMQGEQDSLPSKGEVDNIVCAAEELAVLRSITPGPTPPSQDA